ncbi:MAG: T9SS type A sorting domain-containing protein [Sphingobacteriales bacterium]|nr:MAG: T9SS type A sorting domain-containing protein [Sphingobacteriales bacterium]
MKRISALVALSLSLGTQAYSKHIDVPTARQAGRTFLQTTLGTGGIASDDPLTLTYAVTGTSVTDTMVYVFARSGTGFVLVSADDRVVPILGFSNDQPFRNTTVPVSVQSWMEGYARQIQYAIDHQLPATASIAQKWNEYSTPVEGTEGTTEGPVVSGKTAAVVVSPLVQTTWNQDPYYNSMCPYDAAENELTVTGCTATAMAQIMKYWNHPATGTGSHSYYHNAYGQLSANFGNTTYQWASMPNGISANNAAIATLMYQAGVSVNMNYNTASNGGSGAYVVSWNGSIANSTETALPTYFGYKNTIQGVYRTNFTDATWISLIKSELNAARPVLYTGYGTGGGHAFVCDGYNTSDFFHFNWGWGGSYNGYFEVNALNPSGVGTGGGTGGFNSGQEALVGIEPNVAGPAPDAYETNNSTAQAYTLPMTFSGNTAVVATQGANLHSGADVDYYKLEFPAGATYTVVGAQLFDAINPASGTSYTVDARMQYSLNGTFWSVYMDSTTPAAVNIPATSNAIYFKVTPKTVGQLGTYDLQMTVSRSNPTAVTTGSEVAIAVYPNPATDAVLVSMSAGMISQIGIYNLQGQQVRSVLVEKNTSRLSIPLKGYATGIYLLKMQTTTGELVTRRLVVQP